MGWEGVPGVLSLAWALGPRWPHDAGKHKSSCLSVRLLSLRKDPFVSVVVASRTGPACPPGGRLCCG